MQVEYDKIQYSEKEGLSYDGQLLTDFNISITKKKTLWDSSQNKRQKRYRIEVSYMDGRPNHSEWVDDPRNLDLFDLFGINEGTISNEIRKILMFKLMHEAEQISWESAADSHLGLQIINEHMLYVLGQHVLWEDGNVDAITVLTHYKLATNNDIDRYELLKECCSYISLIPGITEILFYGSLFAIIKPFLAQLKIPCGCVMALVAPAGHLKTTLVRMYALWLDAPDQQEIGFYSHDRDKEILNMIERLQGQNFLLDDMHKIKDSNESRRQERRLDTVSRHVNMKMDCANVIMTGETMEEMGIFSCMDRIFQIRMPKMNAGQIEELKRKISLLQQGLMPDAAYRFAESLMGRYGAVLEDIRQFYSENLYDGEAGEGYATRIYRHGMFIRMTGYLFEKYLCDPELYCLNMEKSLASAIKEQIRLQQEELQKIRAREESRDYVAEFYEILYDNGKYIQLCAQKEYVDCEKSCVLCKDKIYITTAAIKTALFNRYQQYVAPKLITDALHEAGILEEEPSSNGRQKNFAGKKHYVLCRKIFANYMCRNGYELTKADREAYG